MSDQMRHAIDALRSPRSNLLQELEEARLPLAPGGIDRAKGSYGAFVVVMHPMDFLRLTTTDQEELDKIFSDDFAPLADYRSGANPDYNKDNYGMPFLRAAYPSGKVTGHEGRHRAAMIVKAGGAKFPCIIYLKQDQFFDVSYYESDDEDAPKIIKEFGSMEDADAFVDELKRLRMLPEHPFYSDIKITPVGGWTLKGHPGRSLGPWQQAKWTREDMVPLKAQFNDSFVLPVEKMKIGIVKGYRHFKA